MQAALRPAANPLRDTHEILNAVLWVQTAGEFWALTSTTYNSAQVAPRTGQESEVVVGSARTKTRLREFAGCRHSGSRRDGARQLAGARSVCAGSHGLSAGHVGSVGSTGWRRPRCPELSPSSPIAERHGVKVFSSRTAHCPNKEDTLKNLAALGITASDRHGAVLGRERVDFRQDRPARGDCELGTAFCFSSGTT